MKKKLILPVKSQWFQMEKAGIKPEDYREIKPYWEAKFCKNYFKEADFCIQGDCPICKLFQPIEYEEVELTEGYPKREDQERRLIKKFKRVWISWGRPEWGAPEKRCFERQMKLYARNNIVKAHGGTFFILQVGTYLHLVNKEEYAYILSDNAKKYIKDIELSDWILDQLFKKDKEDSWIVDSLHTGTSDIPYFRIEKDESGEVYCFTRGGKCLMYMGYIRELQNIYHLYSDYEDGDYLNEDIDEKIKKLLKLI